MIYVNDKIVEYEYYPDGSPFLKEKNISKNTINRFSIIFGENKILEEFNIMLIIIDAYLSYGLSVDSKIFIPYYPCARQDKIQAGGDILNPLLYIGYEISRRDMICYVLDPHSYKFKNYVISECMSAYEIIENYRNIDLQKYDGIIIPDNGARIRASQVSKLFKSEAEKCPLLMGYKIRNPSTGELTSFSLDKVPEKYKNGHFLVVDDICDGGGTFIGLSHEIEKHGITADLYVTHGIFSKGTKELLKHYKKIICTDSFISNKEGVNVINICKNLIEKGW